MRLTSPNSFLCRQADTLLIIGISLIPLALHFPYRVNIFLSYEGAWRLYSGQVPYRDFGLPMGFGYWLMPALFFKVFGPSMMSLIKAQVLLNILGGLAFRGILKRLDVPWAIRLGSVLVWCLSYIQPNFWPWYNHTDILYGIMGLYLLLEAFGARTGWTRLACAVGAGCLLFLSFFTKQDGGMLMIGIGAALALYNAWIGKRWRLAFVIGGAFVITAFLLIFPFTRYSFGYWFNHGQPPHTARLSVPDILEAFFNGSEWIKFYLLLIILLIGAQVYQRGWRSVWTDRTQGLFLILTMGVLGAAAVFQVTSYTPPDNNIFFHAFALAYILTTLARWLPFLTPVSGAGPGFGSGDRPGSPWNVALLLGAILLWWSGSYWKYFDRLGGKWLHPASTAPVAPTGETVSATGENVINRHTFMRNLDTAYREDESTWVGVPDMPSFHKMLLPPSTVAGMERLKAMPMFAGGGLGAAEAAGAAARPHVMNMSELTPLVRELDFTEDKGPMEPLWYHLGVCMFNREADTVCARIRNGAYDMVLYEYVPVLNNFYPFRVRDSLRSAGSVYVQVDSFLAPRRPTNGWIEVYVRKASNR
jgi:hypothetical protein